MSRRARIDINRFFDEFFAGILDGRIESKITRKDIRELLTSVRRVFLTQPMFLRLDTPVVVCGDLHGQFNDVVRIFDAEGFPHMRNYLFLGDYIDRGQQSVELILFMFACKVRYPKNFFMLRGNHETSSINKAYGFHHSVMTKYKSEALYENFQRVFDCMPLSALISDRILCMHGGLSPGLLEAKSLDILDKISRPLPDNRISADGNQLATDLLWADPDINVRLFSSSNRRGIGRMFGQEVIDRVRQRFGIDLIVRAHQTSSINKAYGFHHSVMTKYKSEALYENFQRVFDCMPLSALISDRILCMHGGLSPGLLEAKSLDILDKISRPLPDNRISADGNQLATDLLWADPDINVRLFSSSNRRGIGRMFGQEVIDRVRQRFGIDLIVRAHQVVLDGHEFFNDDASSGLITLFTAPHYCGQYDNSGAIMRVAKDMGVSFKVFKPQLQNNNSSRRSKRSE
uniref:Serine/threonine-protein phosphatase n=2 Tax=Meloidogyne TaxID=189290 RepID=A0A914LX58_MELIC